MPALPRRWRGPARPPAAGISASAGGPSTIREFLAACLTPCTWTSVRVLMVLGRGERLWDGLEALEDRFQVEVVATSPSGVTHYWFSRRVPG